MWTQLISRLDSWVVLLHAASFLHLHTVNFVRLPLFVIAWATFSLAATVNFLLRLRAREERLSLRGLWQAHFPRGYWRTPSARIDIAVFVLARLIEMIPLGLAWTSLAAILAMNALHHFLPHHAVHHANAAMLIFCALVLFLVSDFTRFTTHYLQHVVPFLWELHKVHHSATFLNPLTAEREHPLGKSFDGIINALVVGCTAGMFAFLYNIGALETSLMAAITARIGAILVPNSLKHSHLPISFGTLEAVLISPRMHHIHHSARPEHWDKNFGDQLSIWDLCFGTRYIPAPKEHIVLGLGTAENTAHESLWGVTIAPFFKIGQLFKDRLRRRVRGDSTRPGGFLRRQPPVPAPVAPSVGHKPDASAAA